MAQDYAQKKRPTRNKKRVEPRVPAWVWLFTGGVLGAFIMFLMRLSEIEAPEQNGESPLIAVEQQVQETTNSDKADKPRFNFYELLKETTVEVPDSPNDEPTTETSKEKIEYILQVASFHEAQDAQHLRAELILLNMQAEVETVTIRNGETWHRVMVGPFVSRSKLSKARSTLASNNLNALVLKRPLKDSPHG